MKYTQGLDKSIFARWIPGLVTHMIYGRDSKFSGSPHTTTNCGPLRVSTLARNLLRFLLAFTILISIAAPSNGKFTSIKFCKFWWTSGPVKQFFYWTGTKFTGHFPETDVFSPPPAA